MRLSKIKMSGFKSFVDPTILHLPSNLVGIVGPNGCGKSNVIDAVRWVMGESSAKQLRGDSMADVIFNGSSARKPVSTANIELVFDNSDGAIGGPFANYAEVSVKREVVRDGTSSYFLNNARCRRRDVTDLFLGTGLGPRSYSIIEQGTIARLVESKPEDLRVFLEEAAGISRYKERRRETENRIQHTRENIARLQDLLGELNQQMQHLQRQAHAAERYQKLNTEKRALEAQIKALHWRALDTEMARHAEVLREHDNRLQAAIAAQRAVEAELEKARSAHDAANDGLAAVQARSYELATATARREQALQNLRETRARQQQDGETIDASAQAVKLEVASEEQRLADAARQVAELEPAHAHALAAEQQALAEFDAAERALQAQQDRWDEHAGETADAAQQAEVQRTRIEHLEQELLQATAQRKKLAQQRADLSSESLRSEVAAVEERVQTVATEREHRQAELQQTLQTLAACRSDEHRLEGELHGLRSQLEEETGRVASLDELQRTALGKSRTQVGEWLAARQLDGSPRLAELIEVTAGWEQAVEMVLGYHLEAVSLDSIDAWAAKLAELAGGSLSFVERRPDARVVSDDSLLHRVKSPLPLQDFLGPVYAAESLEAALALRARLQPGESAVTRDGIWLGAHWIRLLRGQEERSGVLARESELKEHRASVARLKQQIDTQAARQDELRSRLRELEAEREQRQADVNLAHRRQAETQAELKTTEGRLQHVVQDVTRLNTEIAEQTKLGAKLGNDIGERRAELQTQMDTLQELEDRRSQLETGRSTLRTRAATARERARTSSESVHTAALDLQARQSQQESAHENLARLRQQIAQMDTHRQELQRALAASLTPLAGQEAEFKGLLERRAHLDAELAAARERLEALSTQVRELEQARQAREQHAEECREQLQQLRLGSEEARVRRETLSEQLRSDGYEPQTLLADLPAEAKLETWPEKLTAIEERIARLGAINLAAIQEYNEQSERKQYLDAQLADLSQALATLEEAIRKIDRETRTRFQETFDRVNAGLQTSFPKLFGGGHAYLELTGEELLDAGVAIMARPPGKRNSTIHLLSGGEKALTAVALVFAIFELNPAPFCMLDEVDAPLDEANIGRFADLVRGMSDRVQFVFITHNKAAMETANQLIGVTMNEPGVSRLVDVDVEEAVRIAAT
ncbi:MAG: chromosome segregation protein SMC [Gammaproteobacteria bacterium]